jgi:hypothetical protein
MFIFLLCGCTSNTAFKDAYAIVYKDSKPYLLNKNNELYDLSKYDYISDTFGKYIVVGSYKNKIMKYGYIDNNGDVIIKPQYDHANPFSEGYAVVSKNDSFSIINEDNKVVYTLPEGYASYSYFKNGFLKIEKDGKSSLINKNFEMCDKLFDSVENFNEGYALVINNVDNKLQYNFINEEYELLFDNQLAEYDFVDSFHDGYARVGRYINEEYYYSYINKDGQLLKDSDGFDKFIIAENFSNKHALVYNGVYYSTVGRNFRYSPRFINTEGAYYNYQDFYSSTISKVDKSDSCGKEIMKDFYFKAFVNNFYSDFLVVKNNDEGAGYSSLYKINVYGTGTDQFKDLEAIKLHYESENMSQFELSQYTYPYDMRQPVYSEFYSPNERTLLVVVRIYTDKYAIVDMNGNYLFEAIYDNIIL